MYTNGLMGIDTKENGKNARSMAMVQISSATETCTLVIIEMEFQITSDITGGRMEHAMKES